METKQTVPDERMQKLEENVNEFRVNIIDRLNQKAERSELMVIEAELDSKVSYQHFYWIMGILLTILCGIFAWMVPKVESTHTDVTFIRGKFSDVQTIIKE